jgi:hypothetical protein
VIKRHEVGGEGNDAYKHQKQDMQPAAYNIRFQHNVVVVMGFVPE